MTPASKSQIRAMRIAGIEVAETYSECAVRLEAAGLRGDAVPLGGTWRTAAKLADTDLLTAIRSAEPREVVEY